MPTRTLLGSLLGILLSSSTVYATQQFDQRFGQPQTRQRLVDPERDDAQFFRNQVQPLLDRRCVVCHACYDAPCQLKLSSPEGIERGLHPSNCTTAPACCPNSRRACSRMNRRWRGGADAAFSRC